MTSPVDAPVELVQHRPLVVLGRRGRRQNPVIAASPACTDFDGIDAHVLLAHRRGLLGGEDHVRVIREDEHVVGRNGLDRVEDVLRRRVHRLPTLDHARRAEALEEPAVSPAGAHGDEPGLERRERVGRAPLEEPLLALRGLVVHVRDLDALDDADRRAERERLPGIVGVDVHLERRRVADDEERVADPFELRFERVGVELLALDDEHGAVAELGELQMDRVEAERLRLDRRLGELLTGRAVDHPASDLDEPGAARVDDAGVAQDVEQLRRARDGSSPAASTARRRSLGGTRRCSFRSLSSAISRMTVSIVPSTGRFTARYAVSLAPRNARPRSAELTPSCSPSTSTNPRTIWEKMTPEFPRAPMSAARVTSFATASLSAALDASSASTMDRSVRTRFVPVSPSGTG